MYSNHLTQFPDASAPRQTKQLVYFSEMRLECGPHTISRHQAQPLFASIIVYAGGQDEIVCNIVCLGIGGVDGCLGRIKKFCPASWEYLVGLMTTPMCPIWA
eukprot:15329570-Ditylum_brightwellii.AAC.1